MMLSEETTVATAALPIAALRDHLRLGTGFADIGAQDTALEGYLRAAIAAIEGRTAKALIAREFKLVVSEWRRDPVQTFPISPVASVSALRLVDRAGDALVVDPARYRLMPDIGRPRLEAVGLFPAIAQGGQAEIAFTAGFGDWADVPPDLAQAVMLLAASYFETRHDGGSRGGSGSGSGAALPFGVMALIERWRTVRLLGGRGVGERG